MAYNLPDFPSLHFACGGSSLYSFADSSNYQWQGEETSEVDYKSLRLHVGVIESCNLKSCPSFFPLKVRYMVREEVLPSPAPRRPPVRRISTRRSGYAFSHSQGYGNLVTSQWFLLKRPLKGRSILFTQTDSALAENKPQQYRNITEPESSQSSRS